MITDEIVGMIDINDQSAQVNEPGHLEHVVEALKVLMQFEPEALRAVVSQVFVCKTGVALPIGVGYSIAIENGVAFVLKANGDPNNGGSFEDGFTEVFRSELDAVEGFWECYTHIVSTTIDADLAELFGDDDAQSD